ncbi:uncharacterized protein [Montipora foliosa]|uniref:uncharacterized protein isoform X1 n=1 Tax=Montipora foliosa TaxID=591990 RepID=UPI0035F1CC04
MWCRLVLQTSWLTHQQIKAYKSLDAYNFFVSGWVNGVLAKELEGDKVLLFSRVNHSQRARETPLKTWVLVEKNGTVINAHCNCMAGLTESCTHIGAVLFAVEAGVRMHNSVTCTQERSTWLLPSYIVPYSPVCQMDFISAKNKRRDLLEKGNVPKAQRVIGISRARTAAPTLNEKEFYKQLAKGKTKPAVLSLIPEHNNAYVPRRPSANLPKPLTELFVETNMKLS